MLSISRVRVTGIRLSMEVPGMVPRRDGFGSWTDPMMLVIVAHVQGDDVAVADLGGEIHDEADRYDVLVT
jgi:hypothetical protein